MPNDPPDTDRVRAAEVMGVLCLATDLEMALPFEHGLESTLFAARLAERLGLDLPTRRQVFYGCLLFHAGCTATADRASGIFGGSLTVHHVPKLFGGHTEQLRGVTAALPPPGVSRVRATAEVARRLPRAAAALRPHLRAACEVAGMLARRLGAPPGVAPMFTLLNERWDGSGPLRRASGEELPVALRVVHVARDATVQRMLGGPAHAARMARERAGRALDPQIARALADDAPEVLHLEPGRSAWDAAMAAEPGSPCTLESAAIDRALGGVGDFADLASPFLAGHSAGVSALAGAAAERLLDARAATAVRRAGAVQDIGRVTTHLRVWHEPGPLSPDAWEQVRLHPYHAERVLLRSPALAPLAPLAGAHHERLDGSGYHRGVPAATLPPGARVLAAADAFHAMTQPRPHRAALAPEAAADELEGEAAAGRLDPAAVSAVLDAAGAGARRPVERPAGLTEREVQVVGLLARGLQTKQVAATLGISPKTADHHIQHAYGKIGVSTRAAVTVFAMEHGLVGWGGLPMAAAAARA